MMGQLQTTDQLPSPASETRGIIYPEESLPPIPNILAAIQHVVAMFGATVLGPILMGFNANTAIFFSGIATLIFYAFVRGKVPSYLGSSFSFIAAVIAATAYSGSGTNPNIAVALGGIIVAGALYFLIGLVVALAGHKWLERFMPPVVTGAVVAIIGLNLAPVAVKQVSGSLFDTAFGLATVASVVLAAVLLPARARLFPILIGGGVSYFAYFLACNVLSHGQPIDFSGFHNAAWFGLPSLTFPMFEARAITLIAPVAIVLVAENLAHVRAVAAMTGRNLDPWLGRAFMGDGVATMVSGSFGGTGVTTYAENIGVMSITRNFSSFTIVIAAILAICLGLSPKFGEAVHTIPTPILGGLAFILFGLITANAGRIWQVEKVDFGQPRNLLVAGVAMVIGAGDLTVRYDGIVFGGIATATFVALLLYHVIAPSKEPLAPMTRAE
jgi:putative pyrimidine permease RutG